MKVLLIILGIILFFIGILSIPFHVYTQYIDEFSLYVRWLFVKIHIIPKPEKKKKKKKKKKKEDKPKDEEKPEEEEKEEEKPKEKGDNFIKVFYNNQGVPGMINLIGTIAKKLKKGLHKIGKAFYIRELWLRINVGEGDSAATAEKYGKICAAVYPSLGYIISCVHAKKCSVKIQPDFLGGKKTEGGFKLHLFLVPSKLIGSAIGMGISLGIELLKVLISNAKSSSKGKKETVKAMDNAAEIMAEATEKSVDDDINKTQKGGKNK